MDYLKNNYHVLATVLFLFFILLANLFSVDNYQWTKNTISDLGAQGYGRKWIMQTGFLIFGITQMIGILRNGFTLRTAPIFIYAFCVALTGIFCTKPFFNVANYSVVESKIHSALAQIAGVSFTLGTMLQLFYTEDKTEKRIHFTFFILVIILSASFGFVKNYQGIVQRILYLVSFTWLIKFYKP